MPADSQLELEVSGEDLIEVDLVRLMSKSSGFIVSGVGFQPGPLGSREVCVEWRGYQDYVRLQVK